MMKYLSLVNELIHKYKEKHEDQYLNLALDHFYLWYETEYPKKTKINTISQNLKVISNLLVLCKNEGLHLLDEVFMQVLCAYCLILHREKTEVSHCLSLIYASIIYNSYYINHAFDEYIDEAFKFLKSNNNFITPNLKKTYELYLELRSFNEFINNYPNYHRVKTYISGKITELTEFLFAFLYPDGFISLGKEMIKLNNSDELNTYNTTKKLFIYPEIISYHNDDYRFTFQYYYRNLNKYYDNLGLTIYYHKMFLILPNEERSIITIDDHNYLHDTSQLNKVKILNVVEENGSVFIKSINKLYPETTILTNILCRDKQVFLIFTFESEYTQKYGINFYLNPKLSLNKTESSVTGYFLYEKLISLKVVYCTKEVSLKTNNNYITYEVIGSNLIVILNISIGDVKDEVKVIPNDQKLRLLINKEKLYVINKRS